MATRQHGLSLPGFLVIVVATVVIVITALRAVPAYIEYASILKAFESIVHDPDMKDAKISDIRMSFIKRALVSDITAIKADDIEIEKDDSGISLSASYSVKVHLLGNVNLLLEFNPSVPEKLNGS
ncbi:MAG: DUF4845 domain-containing protein [Gallionellaceae bacterium]